MAAIFNRKNNIFALSSQSVLVIPTKPARDIALCFSSILDITTKLSRGIARGKGHLVFKFDFDLGKWRPFYRSEIIFLHFSPNMFWLFQRNLVGALLGLRDTLSARLI